MAATHGALSHLLPSHFTTDITRWLSEDSPSFDHGGFVVGEAPKEARLLGKSPGMLAGVPFFDEVFRQLGCTVEWHVPEGTAIHAFDAASTLPPTAHPPMHLATVRGPARKVLLGERVALNCLARCSGIATATARMVSLVHRAASGTGKVPIVAGTRKTTPGFRLVEKYGMLVGGADPHRHDLSSMTMLKDNHVWARGGDIGDAIAAARRAGGFALKVEVECGDEAEARLAIQGGADIVMLDNFEPREVGGVASRLREDLGGKHSFLLEISGGLGPANIAAYAAAGVDILSTSAIHQGVGVVDVSLKIVH